MQRRWTMWPDHTLTVYTFVYFRKCERRLIANGKKITNGRLMAENLLSYILKNGKPWDRSLKHICVHKWVNVFFLINYLEQIAWFSRRNHILFCTCILHYFFRFFWNITWQQTYTVKNGRFYRHFLVFRTPVKFTVF